MLYNLKHIYLEFCEPENNDPLFVSEVLATFPAQRESVSGRARWKAYWKTVKCEGSKAISKHHTTEGKNH